MGWRKIKSPGPISFQSLDMSRKPACQLVQKSPAEVGSLHLDLLIDFAEWWATEETQTISFFEASYHVFWPLHGVPSSSRNIQTQKLMINWHRCRSLGVHRLAFREFSWIQSRFLFFLMRTSWWNLLSLKNSEEKGSEWALNEMLLQLS